AQAVAESDQVEVVVLEARPGWVSSLKQLVLGGRASEAARAGGGGRAGPTAVCSIRAGGQIPVVEIDRVLTGAGVDSGHLGSRHVVKDVLRQDVPLLARGKPGGEPCNTQGGN